MPGALAWLAARDSDLARLIDRFGAPPLWARRPGFATLIKIILEQQVSLASGRAIYGRLQRHLGRVSATRVLKSSQHELRAVGLTRQKASYCHTLAQAVTDGSLDLKALSGLDDKTVHEKLIAVKGIGPWTARIYLLMALRRPDVWPSGDLALVQALTEIKALTRANTADVDRIVEHWRPWRSVAARVLWQFYLKRPR